MKEIILENLQRPRELEKYYRDNKAAFRRAFNELYEDIQDDPVAQFWYERLNYDTWEIVPESRREELLFVLISAFLAGLVAKIPDFTSIAPEFFYPRNLGFVVFPFLTAYFAWKRGLNSQQSAILGGVILLSAIYINALPDNPQSDTLTLACLHLPLVLWSVLGVAFVGGETQNYRRRLDFLRYNGDLVVMTVLILLAGGAMTAITIGLFSLINVNIEIFYQKYVIVWGLASAPLVATYLVQNIPQLVNKVSPVIAKVFTPLVLITLVFYLIAIIYSGKDPYNDREFLIIFNLLLIGVMAIILFSIVEEAQSSETRFGVYLLTALAVVTIIVNCIALSAIIYRIFDQGITPNRLAVFGSNLLMLINLLLVTRQLFRATKNRDALNDVANSIAQYLPVYTAWAMIVTFLFPLIFGFK